MIIWEMAITLAFELSKYYCPRINLLKLLINLLLSIRNIDHSRFLVNHPRSASPPSRYGPRLHTTMSLGKGLGVKQRHTHTEFGSLAKR